jgi:hypothetical protein
VVKFDFPRTVETPVEEGAAIVRGAGDGALAANAAEGPG